MYSAHATLPYQLEDTYILQFGNFYFYEKFVVSEIEEGVLFNKEKAHMLLDLIHAHYGQNKSLGYISNRVHNYKVSKAAWKAFNEKSLFNAYASIPCVKKSFWTKLLSSDKEAMETQSFDGLFEAASWITSINILIQNKKVAREYISPLQNKNYFL